MHRPNRENLQPHMTYNPNSLVNSVKLWFTNRTDEFRISLAYDQRIRQLSGRHTVLGYGYEL